MHMKGHAFIFRVIPTKIATIEELRLPASVKNFIEFERGLVVITGATGSGKSTTMAALVDGINSSKKKHIITIEDPVEFVHNDKKCIIEQRDIGEHTHSFHSALISALREDPDVIVIGEMRDLQTIETALHAANTGHLVISTLHSLDAKETINRIISVFPAHEQNRIRITLASVIKGIISQRLVKTIRGRRTPAVEMLVSTDRIKDMILKNKELEITEAIEEGGVYGMQSFDQALFELYKNNIITLEEAMATSTSPHDLKLRISNSEVLSAEMDDTLDLKDSSSPQQSDSFVIPDGKSSWSSF
jgi:twitching motility protein PilT